MRTFQDINQDYHRHCAELGHETFCISQAEYAIEEHQKNAEKIRRKLITVSKEAAGCKDKPIIEEANDTPPTPTDA